MKTLITSSELLTLGKSRRQWIDLYWLPLLKNTSSHPFIKSTADPRDHFEVTARVPVAISKPIFSRQWNCSLRQCHRSRTSESSSDYSTAICMLLTTPKTELHSWREESGPKLSQNRRTRKIDHLHVPIYVPRWYIQSRRSLHATAALLWARETIKRLILPVTF
jgi:hypothetical protein